MVLTIPGGAARLPPSWNAHRQALAALGLSLDADDCYGLGGGLGFLYHARPAPALLGFGSLDPTGELIIAAGAWPDRKHSRDRAGALAEMREHLARERTPVIVAVRPAPGEEVEVGLDGGAATFVTVWRLDDDWVEYGSGAAGDRREVPLASFVARLVGEARRWSVVLGNGHFTDVAGRVRAALRRSVHAMATGWRAQLGGLAALEAFCQDVASAPEGGLDVRVTLASAAQLAGGMGRGLFAAFLDRHRSVLPAGAAGAAAHFRELDERWRGVEAALAAGRSPLLTEVREGERAGLARLQELLAEAGAA